jgi:hypothetical protein
MARLLLILCCLAAGGCISHEARVTPPEGAPVSAAVGTQVLDRFSAPIEERSPLPRSIPVTVWRQDEQGNLFRGDGLVETPLPWWQRFPADAVSDLVIPRTMTAEATGSATLHPVPATDPDGLAAHARAAGYAAPIAKASPP